MANKEVGGFGTLLLFCFDYVENPKAWRHSMELLAREVEVAVGDDWAHLPAPRRGRALA